MLIENNKNLVCFKSPNVTIRFIYSSYEFEYRYTISQNTQKIKYENFLVEAFLQSPKQVYSNEAATNRIQLWAISQLNLFEKHTGDLLMGNKEFYDRLGDYYHKRNADYTRKMG